LSRRNLQTLPDTLDHTEMTAPIRDQGNLGSCSAFAAATVKTYHERLDSGDMTYQMSPLFVYSFRSNVPLGGMTAGETALILENYGDCFEDTLPYDDSHDATSLEGSTLSDDIIEEAAGYKILQRIQWTPWVGRTQDLDEFKQTCMENLNAYGPAWFAVTVYNYGCELYKGNMPQGGHAMALVGYDADGMIFQNSWGVWCGNPGPGLSHIPWEDAKEYIDEINWYEDDSSTTEPTDPTPFGPGNVPASTCTTADSGGACGDIRGTPTTCPAGESCSMFGTCGTSMIHTRTAQTDFSDGNCPASAKSSLNTFSIVGGETSNIVNLFALIGLLSVFYYISTTISNQFKSYERIDMVCESEI